MALRKRRSCQELSGSAMAEALKVLQVNLLFHFHVQECCGEINLVNFTNLYSRNRKQCTHGHPFG